MSNFRVSFFGKFGAESKDHKLEGIRGSKVQELFSYLLLFRNQPQSREFLCELLWGEQPPAQSKKNLRQTLWRLQTALKDNKVSKPILLADEEWIQVNPSASFWLDVAEFEHIFNSTAGKRASQLTPADVESIQTAIAHYKGDLLEGWYHDWCLYERERYQIQYLMLLYKLVEYCEIHRQYETGRMYGAKLLRQDHASERAHRQMMRLYFMAGDRTQALYQYKRCEAALRSDLEVEPSALTKQLYEQIRLDTYAPPPSRMESALHETMKHAQPLSAMLNRLEQFSTELTGIQAQIKREIAALESVLSAPQ